MINLLIKEKMKHISIFIASLMCLMVFTTSCNDEWTEEQYTNYISFRAPLNEQGVTNIYVPYSRKDKDGNYIYGEGKSNYQLPVIVSGSKINGNSYTVHIAHDNDTLNTLNYARFQNRKDLYYVDMNEYSKYPETLDIPGGNNVQLLNLEFDFKQGGKNIDMSEKWLLPLTIADDPSYGYQAHPRKNYAKAMLRVFPFNYYSGDYSGTALKFFNTGDEANATTSETVRGYVVDEQTLFFYAGNVNESRTDRRKYKVYAHFNGRDNGTVTFYTDNDNLKLHVKKEASFRVVEQRDEVRPYLIHRYVIINNISYDYVDYTSIPGTEINYSVSGTLTLERNLNTQIPDEDQAIEW